MLTTPATLAALVAMPPGTGVGGAEGPGEPGALPVGEDFRVSGILATSTDSQAAVAWNPATDEYLVFQQDLRNADRGYDIYGRRLAG